MKLMFISDIHGSLYYLNKVLDRYEDEKPNYIIILGDILYHGPRNPLPKEYNPQEVANKLNNIKDKIIAIRGNCDSEVDQMVLEFPIVADYNFIIYNNRKIFITHGHKYTTQDVKSLSEGDIFISGHTHIPIIENINNKYILNPGSVSLPKNQTSNSYAILNNNVFEIKDLEGEVFKSVELN